MSELRTRDGLRLAYRTAGQGPLLVCQSGGPGRASTYLRDLGGLTATRTLLLLDSRGTGDSDRPEDAARLGFPYLADDLEDLREHLGVETFDLLAHSAGAVVAQAYAAAHPDRIRGLVLVTPSGRLQGPPGDIDAIVASRRGEPGYDEHVDAYETRGVLGRPLMYGVWDDATAAHAAGADTEMDGVAERHFAADADAAAITGALGDVTARVLVVAGDKDAATGVEAAHRAAACFRDARVEVLDGVGHFPWVERGEEFAALVENFLGRT